MKTARTLGNLVHCSNICKRKQCSFLHNESKFLLLLEYHARQQEQHEEKWLKCVSVTGENNQVKHYNLNSTVRITGMINKARFISKMGSIDICVKNHIRIIFAHFQHVVSRFRSETDSIFCYWSAQYLSHILHHNRSLTNETLWKHTISFLCSGWDSYTRQVTKTLGKRSVATITKTTRAVIMTFING